MKSVDLIGHIKFPLWGQLDGCSMTRPFLSLQRVWLARLMQTMFAILGTMHVKHRTQS